MCGVIAHAVWFVAPPRVVLCDNRMEEDRLHRARQRQGLIDSLQYEWQRQKDLKALMSETEKKLR